MRNRWAAAFIGACSIVLWFVACPATQGQTAVEPFALRDVRLLNGPFKQAQNVVRQYILAHDPNRFLAPFRKEAGLESKAEMYGDWESGGLSGHVGGHYLTALAQMAAATGDPEMQRRLDYMVQELAACQQSNGNGYVGGVPNSKQLWDEIASGKIDAQAFSLNGRWVPLYNLHKLWAGLRDAYLIGGNEQAREVLVKLTDWWMGVVSGLSDEQIQQMLRSEHGGLNEVFADVYAITGEKKYLDLAKRFNHRQILDPLVERQDRLTGLHANTQIPKVVGFQRIAQLAGETSLHEAAEFFWEAVTSKRSIALGGNSVSEHFNPVDDFQGMLEHRQGPETCNTYNMLRLSELLFYAQPEARYADFYERAMFNHILSSQHPETPGFVYFTPIRPRHYRVYSQPEMHFWCCVGSGMENHSKYGQFIYARSPDSLYVNLFVDSVLTWKEKGLKVGQVTSFPDEPRSSLRLLAVQPTALTIRIRYPAWVEEGKLSIKVNGEPLSIEARPGSYVPIARTWRTSDRIDVELPMHTEIERLPDGSDYVALVHGPIVLAAKTGTDDLEGLRAGEGRWVHIPNGPLVPLNEAPMLVTEDAETLSAQIKPVEGKPMTFTASALIRPEKYQSLELVPFFRVHDARYMSYWRVATPEQYEEVVEQLKAEEQARLVLEQNTLDKVVAGEQQPEMDHAYQGEQTEVGELEGRHWRDSAAWFSYELRTKPGVPVDLLVTYGAQDRRRRFDILVNDKTTATVSLNRRSQELFAQARYRIDPEILAQSENGRLTVRFQAQADSRTARICEVRLVNTNWQAP
ncbi:MAG: glycoside hydrolase family 127 protein [Sedimentisphaerales bacterium]|nr:glycoside hydrolase family 127 protein [Sedimentisphaerales bacterium]